MPWYGARVEVMTTVTVEFEAADTEEPEQVALQVARDLSEADEARLIEIHRVR